MSMSPKFWNISLQLQNPTSYLQNCKLIGWLFKYLTQCHTFIVRPTVEEHCNEGLYFILFLQSGIPHLWLKSEQITQTRGHMSASPHLINLTINVVPYNWYILYVYHFRRHTSDSCLTASLIMWISTCAVLTCQSSRFTKGVVSNWKWMVGQKISF